MNSICYINGKATTDAVVKVFPVKPAIALPVTAKAEEKDVTDTHVKVTATVLSEKIIPADSANWSLRPLSQPVINVSGTATEEPADVKPVEETKEEAIAVVEEKTEEAPKKKKVTSRKKKTKNE